MDDLIIFGGKYLVFLVPLIVLGLWLKQSTPKRLELAVAVGLAGLTSLALTLLAAQLYNNPRPFMVENIQPLISHGNDNGFPSQHTAFAMTLTTIIYFYSRRWAVVGLATTLTVGIARVLADVHHGVDIIGGLVVGIAAGCLAYCLAEYLLPAKTKSKETEPEA